MATNPNTLIPLQFNANPPAGSLPPQIPTLSYADLLSNLIAVWAANTGAQPQLNSGDPLLAIFQAFATEGVFLENMATQLAALTRAQTSQGANLDTWMAQFQFTRLPAEPATGSVLLSANSAHNTPVNIPLGTVIQTAGGSIQYQLIADTTQSAYDATTQMYVLPSGTTSITATAQALVAGTSYDVQANQLVQFATPVSGIDNVTNPAAIVNGVNAESDTAFRARFLLYLLGLREAVLPAVESAIEASYTGIQYVIVNNQDTNGNPVYGYFYVTIWPYTSEIQALVYNAIAQTAALGIQFNVYSATEVTVTVSVNIEVVPGQDSATVQSAVQGAIESYISGLTLGENLYWSYLYDVIYSVSGVLNALNLQVNGGTADVVATPFHIIQPSTITVNIVSGTA